MISHAIHARRMAAEGGMPFDPDSWKLLVVTDAMNTSCVILIISRGAAGGRAENGVGMN
jgi:hypothetical protein